LQNNQTAKKVKINRKFLQLWAGTFGHRLFLDWIWF